MTRDSTAEPVTDRQLEVARLIYLGRTNGEIAQVLGVSLDGAKYHVSQLLGRLGVERREDIGAWYAAEHRSALRERLAWLATPVGLLAGGAATVALAVVAVILAAATVGSGSGPAGVPFVNVGGVTQTLPQIPGVSEPGRTLHTATLLQDGRVLVIGGFRDRVDPPAPPNALAIEIFDPATGTFARLGSLQFGLYQHGAVLLDDGRVVAGGGQISSAQVNDGVVVFVDPSDGSVTTATATQSPVVGLVPFEGTALLVTSNGAVRFDADEERWVGVGLFDPNRLFTAVYPLDGGSLLFQGSATSGRLGQTSSAALTTTRLWALDPGSNGLRELTVPESPPFDPRYVPVEGGGLLLVGGWAEDPAPYNEAISERFFQGDSTAEEIAQLQDELNDLRPPQSSDIWYFDTVSNTRMLVGALVGSTLRGEPFALPDGRLVIVESVGYARAVTMSPNETKPQAARALLGTTNATLTELLDGRLLVTGGETFAINQFDQLLALAEDGASLEESLDALPEGLLQELLTDRTPNGAFLIPALP